MNIPWQKIRSVLALGLLLGSCGIADAQTIVSSDGSEYSVQTFLKDGTTLPQNSDLKMLDGDVVGYARQLCALDDEFESAPESCHIFVQPSPEGALIGYAVLRTTKDGVEISTAIETNRLKGAAAKGCWIGGKIYEIGSGYEIPIRRPTEPFEGQMMYSAWERSAGDFLISEVDSESTDDDPDGALGVWYIRRTDTKLRIEQERWNYCFNDVVVDEVFDRLVTLIKQ